MVFLRHGVMAGGPRGTGILKGYVYDMVTQTWTITQLSEQRWDMGIVSAGNKVFFAGGFDIDYPGNNYYFSVIDIYDASTDSWSVSYLSKPRRLMAATAINNKIFFAGGYEEMSPNNYPVSNLVEICDLSTNSWSVNTLTESRVHLSATTLGSKIYFAGGINGLNAATKTVDVYDNSTHTWSTFNLQEPKAAMSSIAVDNKIYWAGGVSENMPVPTGFTWVLTSQVEIKDINTGNSTITCLFQPNYWPWNNAAVQKNDKIVFFTGPNINAVQNKFDIYDTSTNSWSIGVLPQNIEGTIISINNTIYVSSGSQLWKLEF
jgi:N-acetylneuraminic acid mutarotase